MPLYVAPAFEVSLEKYSYGKQMETEKIGTCWHCGADLGKHDYGRETNCTDCGKPARVCRNCRWYDPSRTNECQEPVAERVMDKTRANYCEYFEAAIRTGSDGTEPDKMRQAADDLFE